uniref:ATP binding cassette subfamily F member 3 n=1 Tax=Equus asinus asinus TaxID=83772 RepID=A0A8C4MBU2_EQUAS
MATCAEILRSEFPEIDGQVFDYVTGVLHSGSADFESVDDLVEAVGELLQEVSGDSKDDAGIRAVCQRMYNTLRLYSQGNSQVLLDAPIQLSKITENYGEMNAKKLEKAEARLKAKQEKRSEKDTLKTSNPLVLEEASASQAGSRKESRLESSGKNKSYDVRIENFDVSFGDRVLLTGADVNLAWGRRYGLVGRNGLGKTTLLKMLATRSLRVPAHISLLHVEQEVAGDDTPALQSVLESDTVREDLLRRERELSAQIAAATDIIHLHSQRLDGYRGDFETFIKSKQERLLNQQREYEAQQQYRQHIQVFIDRFRYNANRASQVQSKLKMLEKLPELKPVDKELEVVMKFPDGFEKFSPPILQLDEVDFYYDPKHVIFSRLSVSADLESRICVVGENGAGKSTMLKLLMGDLAPVRGIRHAHRNLKIGYFSQHHVEQLDLNVSAVELLARKFPGRPEEEYRHQLGRYGISGELAVRPVASLSGGQKSRVAFAQMTMPCPNFYILDEPTNHLDMETIEALGRALNNFRGGVILVSHDERFIRLVCRELWVCEKGGVTRVEGGFDQYRALLQEQFRREGFL